MKKGVKNSIIITISLFILFCIIDTLLLLDSYHNKIIEKYFFTHDVSLSPNIDDSIVDIRNDLKSELIEIDSIQYIKIPNFPLQRLDSIQIFRHFKNLHPSIKLAYFSMAYASSKIKDNINGLHKSDINEIAIITKSVIKHINSPNMYDRMSYNDHAISERLQFMILFYPYLDSLDDQNNLKRIINKEIAFCLHLLLDDKNFTWKSNHGIMQIRSLIFAYKRIDDKKLKDLLYKKILDRTDDISKYLIANDGAILEASNEYWLYIFDQLSLLEEEINQISPKEELFLKNRLNNSKLFIQNIVSNNGYIQGLGDGYSYNILDKHNNFVISESDRFFRYSNGLAGLNVKDQNSNLNLLFVSLHCPPNIHKLPEDLSVYINLDVPFFTNTGGYSYDNSSERKYIMDEKSQATVYPHNSNFKNPNSSTLLPVEMVDNVVFFSGIKEYGNQKIQRNLICNPKKGEMEISDLSNDFKQLKTIYNIHPNIKLNYIDTQNISLSSDLNDTIYLQFNCNYTIENGWVASAPQNKVDIKRIVLNGNPIITKFKFKAINFNNYTIPSANNNQYSQRNDLAKVFKIKYNSVSEFRNVLINRILFYSSIFLVIILTLFIIFISSWKLKNY